MGRGNKSDNKPQKVSERDMIVQYRNGLRGVKAEKFDEIFYPLIGVPNEGGIRKALNKSANPHKAYVAAKAEVDALPDRIDEEVEVNEELSQGDEGEDDIDWDDPNLDLNDPDLWRRRGK